MRALLIALAVAGCTAPPTPVPDAGTKSPPGPTDALALPRCASFCIYGKSHWSCRIETDGEVCTCWYERDGATLTLPCAP